MPEFEIKLCADARVSSSVVVMAETEEEAERLAAEKANEGNVEWEVDEVDANSVEPGW